MFYLNSFFVYIIEIFILGEFFIAMLLLIWWKLYKKSLFLNELMCYIFIMIIFFSLLFFNSLEFFFSFYNFLVLDNLTFFVKDFMLIFYFIFGICSLNYFTKYQNLYVLPDFYLLLLFLFVVVSVLILSWNLLTFYIALEMQNMIFFVLAGLIRNKWYVIESTFRYFLVSGFATLLFLLSLSFFWLFFGTFDFNVYYMFFENMEVFSYIYFFFFIAILFFFISFALKLGLFPFHWWLVDVYEGIPLLITYFFMVFPKIVLFFLCIKFYYFIFFNSLYYIFFLFFFFILGTIFWSFLRALTQYSLVRFLVYSSMFNLSFTFFGFFSYTLFGIVSSLYYLLIYLFTTIVLFSLLILIKYRENNGQYLSFKTLFNFGYLMSSKNVTNLYIGTFFIFIFLSLGGVPPFMGFIAKFFIFWNFMYTNSYFYFFLFLFISVFACFYYLRFIRFFFFSVSSYDVNLQINLTYLQSYVLSIFICVYILFIFFFLDIFNLLLLLLV